MAKSHNRGNQLVSGVFLPVDEAELRAVARFLKDEGKIIPKNPPTEREAFIRFRDDTVEICEARSTRRGTSPPSTILLLEVTNGTKPPKEGERVFGGKTIEVRNLGSTIIKDKKVKVHATILQYGAHDPTLDVTFYS